MSSSLIVLASHLPSSDNRCTGQQEFQTDAHPRIVVCPAVQLTPFARLSLHCIAPPVLHPQLLQGNCILRSSYHPRSHLQRLNITCLMVLCGLQESCYELKRILNALTLQTLSGLSRYTALL